MAASPSIPRLLLVTDLSRSRLPLLDLVAEAVAGGVDAIYLRADEAGTAPTLELIHTLRERIGDQVTMLVNDAELAAETDAGLHLRERDPIPNSESSRGNVQRDLVSTSLLMPESRDSSLALSAATQRPCHVEPAGETALSTEGGTGGSQSRHPAAWLSGEPRSFLRQDDTGEAAARTFRQVRRVAALGMTMLSECPLIGRSVHSPEEAAISRGMDYLLAGHVFPSASKPGKPPIGAEGLRAIVAAAPCPVLAIGGITAERVAEVIHAGAHGIAVIGAIAEADDPRAAAAALRAALDHALQI